MAYTIRTDNDPVKRSGLRLQLSTSFGIDRVNKQPSLQNRYAQGEPSNGGLSWQGPDQYETYSWGPLISTLEFDGSNYPYDKNGMLVPKGTGNGKNAIAYNPVSFFRTGTTTATELLITYPGPKGSTLTFDIENRGRDAVIPNSSLKRFNFSTTIRNFEIGEKLACNGIHIVQQFQRNVAQPRALIFPLLSEVLIGHHPHSTTPIVCP